MLMTLMLAVAGCDGCDDTPASGDSDAGSAAAARTIELMVGTDAALATQYGDGLGCYVEGLVAHVDYIFGKLAPGLRIDVVLVRHETSVDTRGLELSDDRDVLLERWTDWADAENTAEDNEATHFDYPLLLTAQGFGTRGWASNGPAICDDGVGAIVRDRGYYAAKVMAHEMAHTLGLGHVNGETFLMNSNPGTEWSAESVAALVAIDLMSATCLDDGVAPAQTADVPSFTHEQQCQTRYQVPACGGDSHGRCDRLVCQTGTNTCSFEVGPRLDGSDCGDGLWCMNGECVEQPAGSSNDYVCRP